MKCCQKMYSQISPEILQQIIDSISFFTEIVCMDPMKKISPNILTILTITCNF